MRKQILKNSILLFLASLATLAQTSAPVFPYGAVYFRKSNPPEQDWERDHKAAAQLGHNTFSHRFIWSAIETAPGKFDWRDYDRMMELAAQNGMKVVIREISNAGPVWMYDKFPRSVNYPSVDPSTAVGSSGVCLDDDEVLAANERFQTALVERYRNHPANMGYDLWNELGEGGTCAATEVKFRDWLKAKYGTVEALAKYWHHYSLGGDWSYVHPPRGSGGYRAEMDWAEFRKDNMFRTFNRRVALYHRLDPNPNHPVTIHGGSGGLFFGSAARDDWRAAENVEVTGYTWVASRTGNAPWIQFQAVDYVRSTAGGKPFWHGEAQSGNLWMQPQLPGRPRDDGRQSTPKDVRLWNLVSMALGTRGIFDTRWRPLLDGPLFGAFGGVAMDGSITPQSEAGGKVAKWANAHPDIWKSGNVKGEIGIVYVPESIMFNEVQQGNTTYYAQAIRGAYRAFYDANIQADFVNIKDIAQYPVVYLPYPLMLKQATVEKLVAYVRNGGKLISEGTPGYWGDNVSVGTVQPNMGLDKLFGARESYVEFTPDLNERLTLTVQGKQVGGRYFIQEYSLAGGKSVGQYANGHIAAVENTFGSGKTLLIGTFPGASYFSNQSASAREFFVNLLAWGGVEQQIKSSDPEVKARMTKGAGGTYLWVVNASKTPRSVKITLPSTFQKASDLWQESSQPAISGNTLTANVEDQNVAVIRLE